MPARNADDWTIPTLLPAVTCRRPKKENFIDSSARLFNLLCPTRQGSCSPALKSHVDQFDFIPSNSIVLYLGAYITLTRCGTFWFTPFSLFPFSHGRIFMFSMTPQLAFYTQSTLLAPISCLAHLLHEETRHYNIETGHQPASDVP